MCGLPPGFQFVPSDEDLVVHFLRRKAASLVPGRHDIVPSLDLCLYDPWELRGRALQGGNRWYFFARRTENRVTASGYWEEGVDAEPVVSSGDEEVGVKKTFVFCVGEVPEGTKTSWVMHEYHLLESVGSCSTSSGGRTSRRSSTKNGQTRMESETWVMCRVQDAREGCLDDDDDGTELSCLDEEAFSSLDDDLDEANSWPN